MRKAVLEPLAYAPQGVQVMPFPIKGTVFDLFWGAVGVVLPWCFILIFKYSECAATHNSPTLNTLVAYSSTPPYPHLSICRPTGFLCHAPTRSGLVLAGAGTWRSPTSSRRRRRACARA